MTELKLIRKYLKATYTIGKLYVDGVFFCDTLEDKVRDLAKEEKVPGKTAIPAGTYPVIMTYSPRFKRDLPELLDVPGFDGVRIHSGNTSSDTEGCILVGKNNVVGKVTNSRYYSDKLNDILKEADKAQITIV